MPPLSDPIDRLGYDVGQSIVTSIIRFRNALNPDVQLGSSTGTAKGQ